MQDPSTKIPSDPGKSADDLLRQLQAAPLSSFTLTPQGQLKFNDTLAASLFSGESLTKPHIRAEIPGPGSAEHVQKIVQEKMETLLGSLPFEAGGSAQDERSLLHDLLARLVEHLGSLRTQQVQGLLKAIRGKELSALKASSLVQGRRHIYSPESLTPDAVLTRLALVSAYKKLKAPEHCKPSQVLILDQESGLAHLSNTDFERIGYERFSGRAVRVDIVERVIDPRFSNKSQDIFPSLMHIFRCSESEARAIAKQLKLGKPPEKRGAKTNSGDERRTRNGRNRSGGRKSGFR